LIEGQITKMQPVLHACCSGSFHKPSGSYKAGSEHIEKPAPAISRQPHVFIAQTALYLPVQEPVK
jgi:hypothetical protein